tara:strand:- start:827 stop:1252 length:426 start_codon:yes stop_codon:yes gene_type:complete
MDEDLLSSEPSTNIDNYIIYDDDVCNGNIFMKRYRNTSFLGIDDKVWKLRKFRLFKPYLEIWKENNYKKSHKIKINKKTVLSRLYSTEAYVPIHKHHSDSSRRFIFKFFIVVYGKYYYFASLRLDSICIFRDALIKIINNK